MVDFVHISFQQAYKTMNKEIKELKPPVTLFNIKSS